MLYSFPDPPGVPARRCDRNDLCRSLGAAALDKRRGLRVSDDVFKTAVIRRASLSRARSARAAGEGRQSVGITTPFAARCGRFRIAYRRPSLGSPRSRVPIRICIYV